MRNNYLLVIGSCVIMLHIHSGLFAQKKKVKTYSIDVELINGDHRNGKFETLDGSNLILKEKDTDSLISVPGADIFVVKVKKVNAGGHILKGTGIILGANVFGGAASMRLEYLVLNPKKYFKELCNLFLICGTYTV
jgi:hypothetical protein